MTSTTIPRPLATSMSAAPKPPPKPAAEPSAAAELAKAAAGAALESVVDNAVDAALFPLTAAEDSYAVVRGLYATAQVFREDTTAAHLDVDETAKLELTGKVAVTSATFLELTGSVAVEKQAKGYVVDAELSIAGGIGVELGKSSPVSAELSGVLGVKARFAAKDAASADARLNDLKLSTLQAVSLAGIPGASVGLPLAFGDELATATRVEVSLGAKAAAELSLWKSDAAAETIGAELGLEMEAGTGVAMIVNDEDGKKTATFEWRTTVSAAAEASMGGDAHDFTFASASEEVSVVKRVTYDLAPGFEMKNSTSAIQVRAALRGDGREAIAIETKLKLPREDQQIAGTLSVEGGLREGIIVAAAALGVDAASEAAKSIKVTGEVERSSVTTTAGKIDMKKLVEVGATSETSKKLGAVKVGDVRGFVTETMKASTHASHPTIARINALR